MLEYIPGDFVIIETESAKPRVVKVSTVDEDSVIYCEGWGEVRFYDKIKPIPLTPEILEKNGWEPTKESLGHSFKNKKYPRFALWPINDKWNFTIDGVMVCNTLSCLCYVHELQHLLYGMQLDSNFKV